MKKLFVLAACMIGILALTSSACALSVTYELGLEFSGGTKPAGEEGPWARATFDDHGGTGAVTLTMETSGLTEREILSTWDFNFNTDVFDITKLNFQYDSSVSTGLKAKKIAVGDNRFNTAGAGRFDIQFDFPTSKSTFDAREVVVYNITSTQAITAAAFDIFSTGGGNGQFTTAAHVQRIGPNDESGWIAPGVVPVPEPGTILLLGVGLLGVVGLNRKIKK